MKKSEVENKFGDLLKLNQVCELSNLGATTVRKLAEESGAVRKIGRSYRIKKSVFFDYIEKEYAEWNCKLIKKLKYKKMKTPLW